MKHAKALMGLLVAASLYPGTGAAFEVCRDSDLINKAGEEVEQLSWDKALTPAVNQEAEVEVGQPIMTSSQLRLVPTRYSLDEPFIFKGQKDDVTITVPTGPYYLQETRYESRDNYRFIFEGGGISFVSNKTGKTVTRYPVRLEVTTKGRRMLHWENFWPTYEQQVPELPGRVVGCVAPGRENYSREIFYSGRRGSVITLFYKEFSRDMTQPSFTQELSYDLADGDEIGYRGARFKVLSATNTSIRFVMLKPMPDPEP